MKQAQMKILELLESGKITADEATKLIEAMKNANESNGFEFDFSSEQMEERLKNFTRHMDNFAKEFGGKVEELYRTVEPKIKKASNTVLEKTAAIFDDISKSLNETLENARKAAEESKKAENSDCCCKDEKSESDDEPRSN